MRHLPQRGAARKCADLLDNKWKIRIACAQGACASRSIRARQRGPPARERKSVRSSADLRRQSRRGGQLVRPLCFQLVPPPSLPPLPPRRSLHQPGDRPSRRPHSSTLRTPPCDTRHTYSGPTVPRAARGRSQRRAPHHGGGGVVRRAALESSESPLRSSHRGGQALGRYLAPRPRDGGDTGSQDGPAPPRRGPGRRIATLPNLRGQRRARAPGRSSESKATQCWHCAAGRLYTAVHRLPQALSRRAWRSWRQGTGARTAHQIYF